MKHDVSALFDGEFEPSEAASVLDALRRNGELRVAWDDYQMIGSALRQEEYLATDLTTRVMTGLEHDVTVFAPPVRRVSAWQRNLGALAALVAGVAVVGWVAFPSPSASPLQTPQLALATPDRVQTLPKEEARLPSRASRLEMQEYLVAHQAHAPISLVRGGTQNIRTVSASIRNDGQ